MARVATRTGDNYVSRNQYKVALLCFFFFRISFKQRMFAGAKLHLLAVENLEFILPYVIFRMSNVIPGYSNSHSRSVLLLPIVVSDGLNIL